jgi:hypothetical protein
MFAGVKRIEKSIGSRLTSIGGVGCHFERRVMGRRNPWEEGEVRTSNIA